MKDSGMNSPGQGRPSTSPRGRVAVVCGHTMEKPGALGVDPLNMFEYQYGLEFSKLLIGVLSRDFDSVVYFRDGFTIKSLYAEISKWTPDAAVELHFNSSSDSTAYGTETLVSAGWAYYGKQMQNAMAAALGRDKRGDRGVKVLKEGDRGYDNVSQLRCPTFLIEPFFGSNKEDCILALSTQERLCSAIHAALRSIINNPLPEQLRP